MTPRTSSQPLAALPVNRAGLDVGAGDRRNPTVADRRRSPAQDAAARLTHKALRDTSLVELLDDAVVTVAETLGIESAMVFIVDEDDADQLRLVAGCGCSRGQVGNLRVPTVGSAAGHVLALGESVTWRPISEPGRFPSSNHLIESGFTDTLMAVIHGPDTPFGVIQAHARSDHTFTADELLFVQTVANIVGSAILRDRAELALMEAEEAERRRIAEAVHDDTLQVMLAVALRLEALERQTAEGPHRDALHGITVDAREAAARLRSLSFDLFPEDLRLGLEVVVRRLLEDTADESGVTFTLAVELARTPPKHATRIMYRNIAESVTNVRKHAAASHLDVMIRSEGDGTQVRIADDGLGIPARAAEFGVRGHLGIKGLYERTHRCGGRITIGGGDGGGTVVDFWIPNTPGRDAE